MRWYYLTNTIIVILLVLIVISINNRPSSDLTELYFTDYPKLQTFSDGNFEVIYTIHNLENKDMDYETKVIVKEGDNLLGDFCNELVYLKDDAYTTKICRFKINKFEKVKVKVLLVNKEQEIHFWSGFAKKPYYYEGYGYEDVSCLKTTDVNPGFLVMNARGTYVNKAWPQLDLYINGQKTDTVYIDSAYYQDYMFNYQLNSGENVIDIVFTNDYYDEETKGDRNVYVKSIKINNKEISNFVVDNPSNFFDCRDLNVDKNLYYLSSIRFKVNVK